MGNLINMSDCEKIIFVNGIDESKNNVNISELSSEYPFVVFFTNNTSDSEKYGYPINNIWKGFNVDGRIQGVRLTRFVGIDEKNNSLDIGGHTVKLTFNYETGLIGLYDANKLKGITFVSVSYKGFPGDSSNPITTLPVIINSIDNKFKLTFKFTANSGENATNITSSLNTTDKNNGIFALLSSNKTDQIIMNSDGTTSTNNEYEYEILKDTASLALSDNSYDFYSIYSPDIHVQPLVDLIFMLNPTSCKLMYGNEIVNQLIKFKQGETYGLHIDFTPSKVNSYENSSYKHRLYVELELTNEYATFEDGTRTNQIEIINGYAGFSIRITDNILNSQASYVPLSIRTKVVTNDGTKYFTNENLSKNVNIYIESSDHGALWYAGYENPISNTFNINNFMEITVQNIGTDLLYDWKDPNKSLNLSDNAYEYFYIALPSEYYGIIKPRWDAYLGNEYLDYTHAFTITKNVRINGAYYDIYKSLFKGKLYGKIQ